MEGRMPLPHVRDLSPAILAALLASGLCACGGIGPAPQPPNAVYATTVSGRILAFPVTHSGLQAAAGLGAPASVAGPANSRGLAIAAISGTQYALYVSDPGADAIRVYTIGDSSNQPAPAGIGPFPLGTGDGSPEVMTDGPFGVGNLYVATSKGAIAGFGIGTDGTLTPVPGSPFTAGAGVSQMLETVSVAPPPKQNLCLFTSDHTDPNGGVSAFAVQGNGALAPVTGSPFATVADGGPTALLSAVVNGAVSPVQILYAGLGNAGAIAAFTVAPDCSLTPLPGSPFPAGGGVVSLFAGYQMLFAGNGADGTVSSFTIDQSSGALTPTATAPLAGIAGSGNALEVYGLVLLPNAQSDDIVGLQIGGSATNGARVTTAPGSPFYAGSGTLATVLLVRPVVDPP